MRKCDMVKNMCDVFKQCSRNSNMKLEDAMMEILNMQMEKGMLAPEVREEFGYNKILTSRHWEEVYENMDRMYRRLTKID